MDENNLNILDRKTNAWAHGSITDKEFLFWVMTIIECEREETEKEK